MDQVFRTMLTPGGAVPTDAEFFSNVANGVEALSTHGVTQLIPLAQRAIHDSRPEVSKHGLTFLLAVSVRPSMDRTELVAPCVPDLEQIVATKGDPPKAFALSILLFANPRLPTELLNFISSRLENKDNSDEDTRREAAAMVETRDPAPIHQVTHFLQDGKHPVVTATVLQVLGLTQTNNPEGLSLIESSLNSSDETVRWEAVVAVGRLPQTQRTRFLARLNQILVDPSETEGIRNQVTQAIKN